MRRTGRRAIAAVAALTGFVITVAALPRAATATVAAPLDRACASDRLPGKILAGPVEQTRAPLPTIDVAAPAAHLRLAVASDQRARESGLMCVTRLRPQHGMIFVFPHENDWEFWMKNTLVPLDMVWLSADGEVTQIAVNVPAATRLTPDHALARRHGHGIYVIEIGADEASADGIIVGSYLTLPPLHAVR